MIKIPYERLIEKIVEAGHRKEDIEGRVKAKMEQLSGLISQEGAAHIIANELGIKLMEEKKNVKIADILPGLRDIEIVGKVLSFYGVREFEVQDRKGKVANLLLGDETGKIRTVFWGDVTEKVKDLQSGDIIRVKGGYTKENRNFTEIHLNDRSEVVINPEGETVHADIKPERKPVSELQENDQVELLGTIVDMYEPRFFEDKFGRDGTTYVMNAVLDDGTDNIRLAFFRHALETFVGRSKDEILTWQGNPAEFIKIKGDLAGKIVKLTGRVSKNKMFDRKEFIVSSVELNPDPQEELDRQ